jgi:hypothetical protein
MYYSIFFFINSYFMTINGCAANKSTIKCAAKWKRLGIPSLLALVQWTDCSPAKHLSKLGKLEKRQLHLLEMLAEGEGALLFIANTYSSWKLTFSSNYRHSTSMERMRTTAAIVTMTRTPILQTCQNWHTHLPNKTSVR